MCELLGFSSAHPARLTFSLRALADRGGADGRLHDGWGVAFYQGRDVALFREPAPARESPLVRFLESHGPATRLAVSHLRRATRGGVSLANTQPFARELGGRAHVFAHNGNLPGIDDVAGVGDTDGSPAVACFRPVGQTDSERAFCLLMERMRRLWSRDDWPALEARMSIVVRFAEDLSALGPANFMYSDGDLLFAHGHRRLQPGIGRAGPPGLWSLACECGGSDGTRGLDGVDFEDRAQRVLLIASVPLGDAAWQPLAEGEVLAIRDGQVVAGVRP